MKVRGRIPVIRSESYKTLKHFPFVDVFTPYVYIEENKQKS